MSTLVIKNLPEHLHAALKSQAQRNHRSVNKEAVALIEQAIAAPRMARQLSPPLQLRSGRMLTIEDIEAAIKEGQE
jgi:plasmid stability protein